MSDVTSEQMQFIIEKLLDNASDVKKEREKKGNSQFYDGMMTAYYEMLDTIKNQLIVDNRDLEEFGLNFKLESTIV